MILFSSVKEHGYIQIITMLEKVKELLQEVANFIPKSEKETEEFRLKFLGKKGLLRFNAV